MEFCDRVSLLVKLVDVPVFPISTNHKQQQISTLYTAKYTRALRTTLYTQLFWIYWKAISFFFYVYTTYLLPGTYTIFNHFELNITFRIWNTKKKRNSITSFWHLLCIKRKFYSFKKILFYKLLFHINFFVTHLYILHKKNIDLID